VAIGTSTGEAPTNTAATAAEGERKMQTLTDVVEAYIRGIPMQIRVTDAWVSCDVSNTTLVRLQSMATAGRIRIAPREQAIYGQEEAGICEHPEQD
jgi:hypothetical protein